MIYRDSHSDTASAPINKDERINCMGLILAKTPYLHGSYTYFAVAILVTLPGGGAETVLQYSGSADKPLALCKPGHKVEAKLYRSKPENDWVIEGFKIVYDIQREKADLLLG